MQTHHLGMFRILNVDHGWVELIVLIKSDQNTFCLWQVCNDNYEKHLVNVPVLFKILCQNANNCRVVISLL